MDYMLGCVRSAPGWAKCPKKAGVLSNDTSGEPSGDTARQARELRLGGNGLPQEVIGQQRIRQIEEPLERPPLLARGEGQLVASEALEEHVELLHSAAATPEEPAPCGIQAGPARRPRLQLCCATRATRDGHTLTACLRQLWRSTRSFLISAIALAGFRSLGQASVQFMIV